MKFRFKPHVEKKNAAAEETKEDPEKGDLDQEDPDKKDLNKKTSSKTATKKKINGKPVLEIQLRHGDVVTMCDTHLQSTTDVSSLAPSLSNLLGKPLTHP